MLRSRIWRPATLRSFSSSCAQRKAGPSDITKPQKQSETGENSSPDDHQPIQFTSPIPPEPTKNHPGERVGRNVINTCDLEKVKERLREWSAVASAVVRNRADEFTVKTSSTFSQLGSHLNRVTGYEEIEVLKKQVVEQEARIKSTRQAAREAKGAHDEAVVQRSVSQREVNDLLQRKSSWTDADVSRFTSLVRADHLYEQEEARAKAHVAETEDSVDREFSALMRAILARYHEEQVWSDKIRSASTYGSLAVLGINLVVFVMAIVVVEPWKRRRLAQTFERKVEEMGAENRAVVDGGTARLEERLEQQEKLLAGILNRLSSVGEEAMREPSAPVFTTKDSDTEMVSTEPSPIPTRTFIQDLRERELVVVACSTVLGGTVALVVRSLLQG